MAIDVGVTNVRVGLVDRGGAIVAYREKATPVFGESAGVASVLVECCREVLEASALTSADPVAIGCAAPGCVDPATGVIVTSATPSWEGVDLRAPLAGAFGRPVHIEGDGAAAALGFYSFGPTRGQNHLLGLSLGTGISGGFVVDGKVIRGAGQAALEVGHIPLFGDQSRTCSCGRFGCWESWAGGGALRHQLAQRRAAGETWPELPEQLAELAQAGYEPAQAIWEQQGELFGHGIAVLLDVLNPKTVVLGGGVAKAWNLFKKTLLKVARERSLGRNAQAAILCAPEPERVSLLGAAVSAVQARGPAGFFG